MKMKRTTFIIFLAIIALATAAYLGGFKSQILAQGMTIQSISLANPPVQGQTNTWIVSALVNGWGQYLVGNLNAADVTYQGAKASYPLSITGDITENKGFYFVDNSNPKSIYKYRVGYTTGVIHDYIIYKTADVAPACSGAPVYVVEGVSGTGWFGYTGTATIIRECVYKDNVAVVAPISALPNIIPKIELTVTVQGSPQKVTLQYQGIQTLPNGLGTVSWVNSPVQAGSLAPLSIGNNYVGIASTAANYWKVAYRNDYEGGGTGQSWSDSVTQLDSQLYTLQVADIQASSVGCSNQADISSAALCFQKYLQTLVSPANKLADTLVNSNNNIGGKYTSFDTENGQQGFWVDLSTMYATAPQLQIKVSSQWLGIVFPNGVPQVISAAATPNPFKSGDRLTVTIQVKNVGSGNGNFIVQDFTGGTLQPAATIYPVAVSPGQTGTITFQMIATSASTECPGTVNGKVCDTGNAQCAFWSVQYCMQQPSQCIEGQLYWYGGGKLCTCVNNAITEANCKACDYGVTTDASGKYICATTPDQCKINPKAVGCQPPTDWTQYWYWVFFPAMGALVGYVFAGKKNKKGMAAIGLGCGILVAVFVWWLMQTWVFLLIGTVGIAIIAAIVLFFFAGPIIKIMGVIKAIKK